MPKRGIKKRLLSKVSAFLSLRGTKQRFEIHGEHNQLDCNSPKQSDIKTMSSLTPQTKHRGIRFSRRAVQRSKYLRQKFGVRKTVMGFSPRVGSITEEDESEITLWMLAENAENVISEGMAWLRNSDECCGGSPDMEQEDPEKILQMWIESNSFDNLYDNNDEGDKDIDSSFSEDDDDEQESEVTDDDDDNNDVNHQYPVTTDCDRSSNEDIEDNVDVMPNSYTPYDSETESDDDDTVHHNEDTADNLNETSCSIYVDDESFDELDDDDDDDRDDSYQHSECSPKENDEFVADITEENDTILSIPEIDCCGFSDTSNNQSNKKNISSDSTNFPSTMEMKHVRDMDKGKDENLTNENIQILDSFSSKDFERDGFDNNSHGNVVTKYKETGCENESVKVSGSGDVVDGDDDNQVVRVVNYLSHSGNDDSTDEDEDEDKDDNLDVNHNDWCTHNLNHLYKNNASNNTVNTDSDSGVKICLTKKIKDGEKTTTECQYNEEEQATSDDAVIDSIKEEITEILSRISQIENDFIDMRQSMNEFRS